MKSKHNIHLYFPLASAIAAMLAAPAFLPSAQAGTFYWDIDGAAAGAGGYAPSGTWSSGGTTWSTDAAGSAATSAVTTASDDDLVFSAGTDAKGAYTITVNSAQTARSLRFEDGTVNISGTGSISLGASNFIHTPQAGVTSTIGGSAITLSGSSGLEKRGAGTLVYSGTGTSSLTGGLTMSGGTLSFERSGSTTFSNTNALTFQGGTLQLRTVNTGTSTLDMTFGAVTVNAGGGTLFVNSNGLVRAQASLGAITATAAGGSLLLGVPTGSGSGAKNVTTTSTNDATGILGGRIVYATGTANTGYDFAAITSGTTVGPYTGYTALPTSGGSSTTNYSMAANVSLAGDLSANVLRIATGATANQSLALGTNLLTLQGGALLVTSSANNSTVTVSGTAGGTRLTAGSGNNYDFIVHQFATSNGTTISAVIGDNAADSKSVNFVRTGTGNVTLSADNTYTGNTYINSGILTLSGSITSFGNNQRNIHIAPGASVRTGTFNSAFYSRLVQTDEEVGLFSSNGTQAVDFSASGANLPNAFLGYYAGNGAKFAQTGAITPANGTYRIGFAGSTGQLGIGESGGASLTGANNLIVGGSGVVLMGTTNTFSGETSIRTGGRLILATNEAMQNSALNLGSGSDGIAGTFGTSPGTSGGKFTNDVATTSPVIGGLMGSRNLSAAYTNGSGGNNSTSQTALNVTGFTLNVGAGKTYTYTGSIGGFGAGASAALGGTGGAMTLTKAGDGTQILSGIHSYTGATNVTAGTLIINGSTTASSAVNVTGGTLGGIGTLGGPTTIGASGTLSPGQSPGTMTFADTLSLGGSTIMEIDGEAGAGVTGGHDFINLTGAGAAGVLTYGGTMTLDIGVLFAVGTYTWNLFDFASENSTFTAIALAGQYSGSLLDPDTDGVWDLTNGNETWKFTEATGVLDLTVAIPEPNAAALLGALGTLLLLRRRR
jgi:autotransporter-associated beta strand protein